MKLKLVYLFCLFCVSSLFAQPFYQNYDWDKKPRFSNDGFSEKSMASVKEKLVTEFYFEDDGNLIEYYLEHRVYYLNSDDKIEEWNKIYLPHNSDSSLEVTKARVITKDGNIINLDDSKILTATDEETQKTYKYFAFEGIEKGSYIEYLYVVKRYPTYKGKRLNFQSVFPKNNIEFDLFAPENLIFKFKSYNDLKAVQQDTIIKGKNHWFLKTPKVEELVEEPLASYNSNMKFLIYALDENTASNATNITSYANVAQNIYDYYYKEPTKRELNDLEDFLKKTGYKKDDDLESKIKTIETYIKTNIYNAETRGENLSSLEHILNNKVANDSGIIKLFVSIFNHLDIKFEFVYTCERRYMRFDKDFEANNFLLDVMFYFPKMKKYLAPTEDGTRYGFPSSSLTDTYGLFIKEVKVGSYKSAVGKIKYINPVAAENTIDKMIVDVAFNEEDLTTINVNLKKAITGYYGMNLHPFMSLVKPEDREKLVESYAKDLDEDAEILSKAIENDDPKLFGEQPLKFELNFNTEAFVEKAGNKYLLSVGDLIGPQTELYQETERKLPVDSAFERSYLRTITITIPEGYTILNLEDINISNDYSNEKNEKLMSFDSYYTLEGNTLTITADEHYRMNHIPTEIYEDYRAVINSAADFNKITLVLDSN